MKQITYDSFKLQLIDAKEHTIAEAISFSTPSDMEESKNPLRNAYDIILTSCSEKILEYYFPNDTDLNTEQEAFQHSLSELIANEICDYLVEYDSAEFTGQLVGTLLQSFGIRLIDNLFHEGCEILEIVSDT